METLAARERAFIKGMPAPDMAKRLAPKLIELAEELLREARSACGAKAELRELAERLGPVVDHATVCHQLGWGRAKAA